MDTDVVVVGGGPVGLMLAYELALRDVRTVVLERRPERSPHSRAWGLHARTAETLDRRGLLEPLLRPGVTWPKMPFAGMWPLLDLSVLDSDHPYLVNVPQTALEGLLEQRATDAGAEIRRGVTATGLTQHADSVEVETTAGTVRAAYAVGCDGGRSAVRAMADIAFPGTDATVAAMLCDCTIPDVTAERRGITRTAAGTVNVNIRPGGKARIVVTEFGRAHTDREAPVEVEEFTAAVRRVLGRDIPFVDPLWLNRFADTTRLAEQYLSGRVVLAGDAAHVHFPYGGLGLNLGLQDAVNLGWKLAVQVRSGGPASLLESYHAERYPQAAWVLAYSRAQLALFKPDDDVSALRELFAGLLSLDELNIELARLVTGVATRYDFGGDHPLTGTFATDRTVGTGLGDVRLVEALRDGWSVLIDRTGGSVAAAAKPWADVVTTVIAADPGVPGDSILVRPDGYIAWASADGTATGLPQALAIWFGEQPAVVQAAAGAVR
ncbi:FAD-dependent oxidoreductase [Actinocrispum wychmicini]|uniref:3-(3-hydroxy-phenyl)propionate hydroxylase/monooxygenase n=1 Tax=Actinocrispum wychmicini TaxID=1213861 RepID=A0A4R2JXG3_9PSEU|nr:FAD-dependent oxidoreductase [Actinocrispum wychmicini]TCO62036.1 3-(3-hydroxy-phenyl)propionate hydroxylase/monooxygenase [Actinocrispum wychmicini]